MQIQIQMDATAAASDYYKAPKELINRENGRLREQDMPIGLEKAIYEKLQSSIAKTPDLTIVPRSFDVRVSISNVYAVFTVKHANRNKLHINVTMKTSPNFKKFEVVRAEIGADNFPRGMKSPLSTSALVFVPALKKAIELLTGTASANVPKAPKASPSADSTIAAKLASLDKREAEEIKEIQAKYKKMRSNVSKGLPARGLRPRPVK